MRLLSFNLTLALLALLSAPIAHAGMVEVRAHYGQFAIPKDLNDGYETLGTGYPDVGAPKVMGGDLIFSPPLLSFIVGLRYETFEGKGSGDMVLSGYQTYEELKVKGSRTSLLAGYRPFNNPLFYTGLLASIGVSQKIDVVRNQTLTAYGTTTETNYTGKVDPSVGVALEAGVKIVGFLVGLEAGYLSLKAKSFSNSSGLRVTDANDADLTANLSGSYFKAVIGMSFL